MSVMRYEVKCQRSVLVNYRTNICRTFQMADVSDNYEDIYHVASSAGIYFSLVFL